VGWCCRAHTEHARTIDIAIAWITDAIRKEKKEKMLTLADLPIEIRHMILSVLDDRSFVAALNSSLLWHVHTDAEYESRANRWRGCKTYRDFCRVGNLEGLQALCRRYPPLNSTTLIHLLRPASKCDHMDIVCWLCHMIPKSILDDQLPHMLDRLAPGPRVLAWFIAHHRPAVARSQRRVVLLAAQKGMLASICLMHKAGFDEAFSSPVMALAAHCGHLEVVRFLHENRNDPPGADMLARAAVSGNLKLVAFLCDNRDDGCAGEGYIEEAAAKGHVEALDLIRRRYPEVRWSTSVLIVAAAFGRVAVVEFLHHHGLVACQPGLHSHTGQRRDIRDWLLANDCACCNEPSNNDLYILRSATDLDTMAHYAIGTIDFSGIES
jgi:hypothetical protein